MSKSNKSFGYGYGYERLDSLPNTPRASTSAPAFRPPPPAGTPFANPAANASMASISSQHERLILELLPFKDSVKFHEWLQGPYVRGPFAEFCHDFLAKNAGSPEPDKIKTSTMAKDAINGRNPKYLVYFPDKQGWTAEDHHVRFIVTIIQDNMLKGLWSDSDWKKRNIEIAKAAYEVLSFLRSSYYVQNPPSYTAVDRMG